MATTVVEGKRSIVLTGIDEDFEAGTDSLLTEYWIKSIQFIPGAASDRMIVRDGSLTGAEIFDSGVCAAGGVPIFEQVEGWYSPYIEYDNLTVSSGHKLIIDFR